MSASTDSLAPLDAETFLPEEDPQTQAELVDFAEELRKRGRETPERSALLVGPNGHRMQLPEPLYEALVRAAGALADGYAVTVAPQHTTLSTHAAAELLGISRPTLIKLLEEGHIPYEKSTDRPGAHRRIRLANLLSYKERRRRERREALAELTAEAVEAGFYDEAD